MEFEGIPLPASVRNTLGRLQESGFDAKTGKQNKIAELSAVILKHLDKLQKTAELKLKEFIPIHFQNKESEKPNSHGWSLIRKYSVPETGLLHASDPIASDSIVVKRVIMKVASGNEIVDSTNYYWISQEKDNHNIPLVYRAEISESEKDKLEIKAMPLFAANFENLFTCAGYSEDSPWRTEVDVWKQGKSLGEKQSSHVARQHSSPSLVLQPVPLPNI